MHRRTVTALLVLLLSMLGISPAWQAEAYGPIVDDFETTAERVVAEKAGMKVRIGIKAPYFTMVMIEDAPQSDGADAGNYILVCSCIYGAYKAMGLWDDIEYFQIYSGRYRMAFSASSVEQAMLLSKGEHTSDQLFLAIANRCTITEFQESGNPRRIPQEEVESVLSKRARTSVVDWRAKNWGID